LPVQWGFLGGGSFESTHDAISNRLCRVPGLKGDSISIMVLIGLVKEGVESVFTKAFLLLLNIFH